MRPDSDSTQPSPACLPGTTGTGQVVRGGGAAGIGAVPRRLLIGLVQFYRLAISPVLAPSCRYWPSCSEYAVEALRRHGAARGSWLATKRLCRCYPWCAGGVDNVPAAGFSAGFQHSNKRWRAYFGDRHRDTSDPPSS